MKLISRCLSLLIILTLTYSQLNAEVNDEGVLFSMTPKYGTLDIFKIDPIVIVNGNELIVPPSKKDSALFKKFSESYYKVNELLSVMHRGTKIGTAKIIGTSKGLYSSVFGDVSIEFAKKIDMSHSHPFPLILTTSNIKMKDSGLARKLNNREQDEFVALIKRVLSKDGLPSELVDKRKNSNFVAIENSRHTEFIGSFSISDRELWKYHSNNKDNNAFKEAFSFQFPSGGGEWAKPSLFIIAQESKNGYIPITKDFQKNIMKSENSSFLIDVIDIVGDNSPEIVVKTHQWENCEYVIYGKSEKEWKIIYQGGCGI